MYVNKPYLLLFTPLSATAQNGVIEAVTQATPDPQVEASLQEARTCEPDDRVTGQHSSVLASSDLCLETDTLCFLKFSDVNRNLHLSLFFPWTWVIECCEPVNTLSDDLKNMWLAFCNYLYLEKIWLQNNNIYYI